MSTLETKRGSITKFGERNGGGWRIAKYFLKDESKPDTYDNRHWYEHCFERELEDPREIARKYFGSGILKPVLGGDRTPEYPTYSVHQ